jgi:hypothetical protein
MKKNLLYLMLLFLFSCKKENDEGSDSQVPVIMLTAPPNAQTFSAGQAVTVTATVSDNQKIREIHLEIINTTTGAFITHEHYTPVNASFVINRIFTAQPASAYKIKVEAEDMFENKTKAEVSISSN